MKKILINSSNLHVGGAVQVAVSFILNLSKMGDLAMNFHVIASSAVYDNLCKIGFDENEFASFKVVNYYGLSAIYKGIHKEFDGFDLVFTIFGPLYSLIKPKISVVGFAQAWIIYPEVVRFFKYSFFKKLKIKFKFAIQKFFFKARSDKFFVELDHVKIGMIRVGVSSEDLIYTVKNCFSDIFLVKSSWAELEFPKRNNFSIGFLGRKYDHKNTEILPLVKKIISDKYGLDIDFYVTFSKDEWLSCSSDFQESMVNVFPIDLAECPSFYEKMDAMIFPSLLESFSSMPLESMVMGKPLFASDLPFIRDVCCEHAYYFNPYDAESIAATIHSYINIDDDIKELKIKNAIDYALKFSSSTERTRGYLGLINSFVN